MLSANHPVVDPHQGYDIVAPDYELWRWFRFWRGNEAPLIRQWLKGLKTAFGLDAGSGTGPYLPDIAALGHGCAAMDLSGEMLAINRQRSVSLEWRAPYLHAQGDVLALPFKDEQFDWVLCSRVLSHVRGLRTAIEGFSRVLKSGGECLISDVHPEHPYTHVTIPTRKGDIAIETHKHTLNELRASIARVPSLQVVSLDEYFLADLLNKPAFTGFEKLYRNPDAAVFYVCRLRRF